MEPKLWESAALKHLAEEREESWSLFTNPLLIPEQTSSNAVETSDLRFGVKE